MVFALQKRSLCIIFCHMKVLYNFHNTSRFTFNILGLKLIDLLNDSKTTSLIFLKFSSIAGIEMNVVLFFSDSASKGR